MKIIHSILLLSSLLTPIGTSALEQKIYEVDPNRDLSRSESIAPTFYQQYGQYLFFVGQPDLDIRCCSAQPAYRGIGLWRYDSSNNTAKQVVSNLSWGGREMSNPYAVVNDRIVYFSPEGLVSTDLSGGNQKLIAELKDGRENQRGNQMVSFRGHVYFPVYDNYLKSELWRSDGTASGTSKVDLCIGDDCASSPRHMVVSADKLFFIASSSTRKGNIWAVNHSGEAIRLTDVTVSADERIFPADTGVYFNSTAQLWFTDGTTTGSHAVNFYRNGAPSQAAEAIQLGSSVVAAADEIYVISENGQGTTTLLDIDPRQEVGFTYVSSPASLTLLNDKVYFIAKFYDPINGLDTHKLVSIDGSDGGITEVFEFPPVRFEKFKMLGAKGSKIVLARHVPDNSNSTSITNEIWVSDGTTEGTVRISENGIPNNLWSYSPWHFVANDLFFSGFDEEHGIELWRTDSSEPGTLLAKDVGYGQTRVQKGPLASTGDEVFFTMQHRWYGIKDGLLGHHIERELWKTDASTMESSQVTQWSFPNRKLVQIVPVDGGQYWWLENAVYSDSLDLMFYRYDTGTVTTLITEMHDHCVDYDVNNRKVATLGSQYFFQAPVIEDGYMRCQLWVTDTTTEGTKPLTNFPQTAINGENIDKILVHQQEVYFTLLVNNDEHIEQRSIVYKVDGETGDVVEAFTIPFGDQEIPPFIEEVLSTPDGLYLVTHFGSSNLWLWQPSGLINILKNVDDLSIRTMTRFNQGIAFVRDNAIWSSEGQGGKVSSLIELYDVAYNQWGTHKLYSTPDSAQLIYSAYDQDGAYRMWVTDGTAAGTRALGPELADGGFQVGAFAGSDFYVTDFADYLNSQQFEYLTRYSLSNESTELLMTKSVLSTHYPTTILAAQNKIFIGQEREGVSTYEPGFGGPYVTAQLAGEDFDGDGVADADDALPLHYLEHIDTDNDQIGNGFDIDDDNDGFEDTFDLFPLNASEWLDNDGDGIGDIADLDDDNDGVNDWLDSYPRDSSKSTNVPDDDNGNSGGSSGGSSGGGSNGGASQQSGGGGSINFYCLVVGVLLVITRNRKSLQRVR
ncbi:thrombospondin type 3 repeat-containing protein [Neiella sp. HB171785]|uniref:Thrombospondin type 3 repeat-containing protein n=1 Tax=Neiella litorisoli TaxID=2771431 RepID=A0A8J6QNG1_9GAMM|nr:thrombospondin type 3 repeat-containing protein [Neiella litorisoli]MBD1387921.1 thrombospondin type 3 repeat-containing protein [Neiella litorisoli]